MTVVKRLEDRIYLLQMDPEQVADEIGDFIVASITGLGKTGAVIGLSGGVDSTCVAALANRAFHKYNDNHPENPLVLKGYMLPSSTNSPRDTEDGEKVAQRLGIPYKILPIETAINGFRDILPELFSGERKALYNLGNHKSEVRATVLHALAAIEFKTLLGTGNKDEDYGLAYYTLFGDGAVHISPIGNLPKRLVRQMAGYLGFKDLAYRVSTAGLEPNQTSFKDLGYDYEFAELVLEGLQQGFEPSLLDHHPQITEYAESQIQKYTEMYGLPKHAGPAEMISDIIRRHAVARMKSSLLHPPMPNITLRYE